jgi:hypothetical protein
LTGKPPRFVFRNKIASHNAIASAIQFNAVRHGFASHGFASHGFASHVFTNHSYTWHVDKILISSVIPNILAL